MNSQHTTNSRLPSWPQYIYQTFLFYTLSLVRFFTGYTTIQTYNDDIMDNENEKQSIEIDRNTSPYEPSVKDVLEVKELLFKKSNLPMELLDVVTDYAEYWPHTTTVTNHDPTTPLMIRAGAARENVFLMRSWPLGAEPHNNENLPNDTLEKIVRAATLTPSQPWPADREVPDNATKEVLDKWFTDTLPRGEHPCRKIVFTIKSHDQGWGGSYEDRGTYRGSFTWFDVGLEKVSAFRKDPAAESTEPVPQPQFNIPIDGDTVTGSLRTVIPRTVPKLQDPASFEFEQPLTPTPECLQKNKAAEKASTTHIVTWSNTDNILPESVDGTALEAQGRGKVTATGEFVRNLKLGDVVTMWGKARFPGWVNCVESVQMDVYWAV